MVLRRISNLLAAGQRMQAQALEMHHHQLAVQGTSRQVPAVGERWDPARFLPAPSAFVKRGTCTVCGAPSSCRPSASTCTATSAGS